MLLAVEDLPGAGWRRIDERRWRVGISSERPEWVERARRAGRVTAWRSFEQVGAGRWLWTQATPLVSPADAEASLVALPSRLLGNLRAQVTLVRESEAEPPAISEATRVVAFEQATTGPLGDGIVLYLAWAFSYVASILACSGPQGSWTWADAATLASTQTRHIDEAGRPWPESISRRPRQAAGRQRADAGRPQTRRGVEGCTNGGIVCICCWRLFEI